MDAKEKLSYEAREAKIEALLLELAELKIDGMVEEGVFLETPHYCIIEAQARTLGNQLSQKAQERASREVAVQCGEKAPCPCCGESSPVKTKKRRLSSRDGPVNLLETMARCARCRRDFFPSTRSDGA